MPTISACPSCDKKLKTPDGAEGRKLRCPGCQAALIITEDGLAPVGEAVKPRKGRPTPRDEDDEEAPRRSRRRDEDEDEEDEAPRRRSRKKAGIPMWVWLAGGGVLAAGLIVLVLVLVLGGGNNYEKIEKGMSEKQVRDLMGKPYDPLGMSTTASFGGNKIMYWKKGSKLIMVHFKDDKVLDKEQVDLKEWEKKLKGL